MTTQTENTPDRECKRNIFYESARTFNAASSLARLLCFERDIPFDDDLLQAFLDCGDNPGYMMDILSNPEGHRALAKNR